MSLRDLAAAVGRNPGYISRLETGKRQPSPATLASICAYLGVTADSISTAPAPQRKAA